MKLLGRTLLLRGGLLLSLLLGNANQAGLAGTHARLPITEKAPFTTETVVLIEEPGLTPVYGEICTSGWYRLDNVFGSHSAYLARNAQSPAAADHSGVWQPDLPQEGVYRVEAYVPSHPQIDWPCLPTGWASWDTSEGRYTINHAGDQTAVTIDQAPLNNEWVILGDFFFNAGNGGSVVLNNRTSETGNSKTVAFSGMRFTWLRSTQNTVYIPFLKSSDLFIDVDQAWTTDSGGITRQVFQAGQLLQFHSSGSLRPYAATQANMTLLQQGPCENQTLFSGPINLQGQSWTFSFSSVAPNCTGIFTYTFRLTYQNRSSEMQANFIVSTFEQAFDKCNIPTITQMQTWWNNSPYDSINLYIGGISRATACSNPGLNASWVQTASQQGWNFIPTWVGPQAPCSQYNHKMSSNATTAYQQGREEADAAVAVAEGLGLLGNTVIYYDIESYSGATTACRNTVKEFVKGWVERLHELNVQAGAYGTPYTSYVSDWATISPMPDNVWVASWIRQNYDPYVTVWNISGLNNSLWANHQRLRQYAGDHSETWGGVAFTIDSNSIDGAVSSFQPPAMASPASEDTPTTVDAMQVVAPGAGWVLAGGKLYWTSDNGDSWKDISPSTEENRLQPKQAVFLDEQTGWLAAQSSETGKLALFATSDGGTTWQALPIEDYLGELEPGTRVTAIDFVDASNGWLLSQLPSSNNFSVGRLFRTIDGGATWSEVAAPAAGKLEFITPARGWLAGGVDGGELYQTEDGGLTWQPVMVAMDAAGNHPGAAWASLPRFVDLENGWLPVVIAGDRMRAGDQPRIEVYASHDQGQTWSLADTVSVGDPASMTGPVPFVTTASQWILALPSSGELILGSTTGISRMQLPELSGSLNALDFSNPNDGWGIMQIGSCSGTKLHPGENLQSGEQPFTCKLDSKLVKTEDGGATWTEITPHR